jgi:hypothetical protein
MSSGGMNSGGKGDGGKGSGGKGDGGKGSGGKGSGGKGSGGKGSGGSNGSGGGGDQCSAVCKKDAVTGWVDCNGCCCWLAPGSPCTDPICGADEQCCVGKGPGR